MFYNEDCVSDASEHNIDGKTAELLALSDGLPEGYQDSRSTIMNMED
jgi:hypothetical protein